MALTREQVVDTAVELLRRYGLSDLSMRRLARELGVQPGALYWHVESKQELLVDVAASLLAEIPEPSDDLPALDAVALLARAIRAALAPVPDAADVLGVAYAAEPASVRALGLLRGWVNRAGAEVGARKAVTDLVVHHILGSVAGEQNEQQVRRAEGDAQASERVAVEAARSFEMGLLVILRGMAASSEHGFPDKPRKRVDSHRHST